MKDNMPERLKKMERVRITSSTLLTSLNVTSPV
ncbi:hypothetical protein LEMLEM_LOCUS10214, partial [Lemmus lemmus]